MLNINRACTTLPRFQWQRLRLTVVSTTDPPAIAENPLAVFDAMVRQAKRGIPLGPVIIRTPEHHGPLKLRRGARFALELLVTGGDIQRASAFAEAFSERIRSFSVPGGIQIDDVVLEPSDWPAADEACLWFRTALPVRSTKGRSSVNWPSPVEPNIAR
jgi:hypothetical protein